MKPLLSRISSKVLDYIIENLKINPMLEMSALQSMTYSQDVSDEFVDKVKYITDKDFSLELFIVYKYCTFGGNNFEYMRDGLNTDVFE